MVTTERTRTSDVGSNKKNEVQVIGDRTVINPRIRVAHLRDADGNVIDSVRLSLEVCGCGYSYARQGVGYRGYDGWHCKRCGQLHTLDGEAAACDGAHLTSDASLAREFDGRTTRVSPDWSTPEDIEDSQRRQRKAA